MAKTDSPSVKACTPFDVALGWRLKQARLKAGLSQQIVAQRLGLTFPQIQKYENGTNRVSVARLLDLTIVLDVPYRDLIDRALATAETKSPARPQPNGQGRGSVRK